MSPNGKKASLPNDTPLFWAIQAFFSSRVNGSGFSVKNRGGLQDHQLGEHRADSRHDADVYGSGEDGRDQRRRRTQQSRIHCTRLAGSKADEWWLRQCPKVMNLPFKEKIRRADRDNTINVYISDEWEDVLQDGVWEQFFTEKPEPLTREEKKAWIAQNKGVSLGSDAFFPFGDNIERAHKSGVEYIAEAGGSIRDDNVIDTCDKYGIAMAFTHVRLFHH